MQQMADSEKTFFIDLVDRFKKEIIDYIERKFADQEKLFDAKLDPMGKLQDRLRDDIDGLYDKHRDTITDISEMRTELNDHIKNHDKSSGNIKWTIGIIVTVILSLSALFYTIFGG